MSKMTEMRVINACNAHSFLIHYKDNMKNGNDLLVSPVEVIFVASVGVPLIGQQEPGVELPVPPLAVIEVSSLSCSECPLG